MTMTSQRKAQRFPRRQRVPVTFKRTLLACFSLKCISKRYEKNNQVPMLNPDRQISVSDDTMSHPSLGYRLDWYLWHRITLDWDLSVWIQHWYLILLFFSGRSLNKDDRPDFWLTHFHRHCKCCMGADTTWHEASIQRPLSILCFRTDMSTGNDRIKLDFSSVWNSTKLDMKN